MSWTERPINISINALNYETPISALVSHVVFNNNLAIGNPQNLEICANHREARSEPHTLLQTTGPPACSASYGDTTTSHPNLQAQHGMLLQAPPHISNGPRYSDTEFRCPVWSRRCNTKLDDNCTKCDRRPDGGLGRS